MNIQIGLAGMGFLTNARESKNPKIYVHSDITHIAQKASYNGFKASTEAGGAVLKNCGGGGVNVSENVTFCVHSDSPQIRYLAPPWG